jgi:hypothetical protein
MLQGGCSGEKRATNPPKKIVRFALNNKYVQWEDTPKPQPWGVAASNWRSGSQEALLDFTCSFSFSQPTTCVHVKKFSYGRRENTSIHDGVVLQILLRQWSETGRKTVTIELGWSRRTTQNQMISSGTASNLAFFWKRKSGKQISTPSEKGSQENKSAHLLKKEVRKTNQHTKCSERFIHEVVGSVGQSIMPLSLGKICWTGTAGTICCFCNHKVLSTIWLYRFAFCSWLCGRGSFWGFAWNRSYLSILNLWLSGQTNNRMRWFLLQRKDEQFMLVPFT